MCVNEPRQALQKEPAECNEQDNTLSKIVMHLHILRGRIINSLRGLMVDLGAYEMLDETAIYLAQHPILTVFLVAIGISCGIPILMFVVFAILTVLFTFAGFIVIEGTLLTVGSVLLCGFVLAILIILITIGATIGVAYVGFLEIYGLLQNSPENSSITNFLPTKSATQHPTISTTVNNHPD